MTARRARGAGKAAGPQGKAGAADLLDRLRGVGGSGDLLEIAADELQAVLAGPQGADLPARVTVDGLSVSGPLRLRLSTPDWAERELEIRNCRFDGRVSLSGSRVARLSLMDCEAPALSLRGCAADVVVVERLNTPGHLTMQDIQAGRVRVSGARISGMVCLDGAAIVETVAITDSRIGSAKMAVRAEAAVLGRGIRLGDERAGGTLELDGAISLAGSRVHSVDLAGGVRCSGVLDLARARVETLTIRTGAHVGGIRLDRAELGDVELCAGAGIDGPVDGDGVVVAGRLRLGAEHRPGGDLLALDLSGARIGGGLDFGDGFDSDRPVRLAGCEVGGNVTFAGRLAGAEGNALDVTRLETARLELRFRELTGGVSIRQSRCTGLMVSGSYVCPPDFPLHLGLACAGRAALGAAGRKTAIIGTLSLIDLSCHELNVRRLRIDAAQTGRWAGVALAARRLEVGTLARIGHADDGGDGVTLRGLAAFDYARIGDDLRFSGVDITAPATCAIGAPRSLSLRKARIESDLELGGEAARAQGQLTLTGDVDLSGMTIGSDLQIRNLRLSGAEPSRPVVLDITACQVGGALRALNLSLGYAAVIDLSESAVGRLDDGHGRSWETADQLPAMRIDTLRYDRIEDLQQPGALDSRLRWLERHGGHGGFSPEPYRVLIAALAAAGDANGVKRASLASLRQARRRGSAPLLNRLGDAFLDLTSGYGYFPSRAALTVLIYFLIGWAGVEIANLQGAYEASPFMDGSVLAAVKAGSPGDCPWLQAPLHALDLMAPMTTLGNENFCTVRTDSQAWHWATILYRAGGWVILSIALLTFAGILKRDV